MVHKKHGQQLVAPNKHLIDRRKFVQVLVRVVRQWNALFFPPEMEVDALLDDVLQSFHP